MVARYALRLLVFSPRPWHEPDRCYATTQFVLEHLDGRKLLVSTPPGMVIKPGSLKGIRGEGMPIKGNRFDKVCGVLESAVGKRRAHVLACACVWWTGRIVHPLCGGHARAVRPHTAGARGAVCRVAGRRAGGGVRRDATVCPRGNGPG